MTQYERVARPGPRCARRTCGRRVGVHEDQKNLVATLAGFLKPSPSARRQVTSSRDLRVETAMQVTDAVTSRQGSMLA